jgi:hypothetical protein
MSEPADLASVRGRPPRRVIFAARSPLANAMDAVAQLDSALAGRYVVRREIGRSSMATPARDVRLGADRAPS